MADITPKIDDLTTPATGVEVIKSVMTTALENRAIIDEKKAKVSGLIAQIKKAVPEIKDEAQDTYVNNAIVKFNAVVADMEKLRKAYTGQVRKWLEGEIAPENALKLEIGSLVAMRDARAKAIKETADKESARIQEEKNKALYESEVKGLLQVNLERGLAAKVLAFEKLLDDYFMQNLKVDNAEAFKKAIEGIKPSLKESAWLDLIGCNYDIKRMTPEEYNALVKRARGYWTHEKIGEKYIAEAVAIRNKWIDKIPSRVKELQIIAQGGDQAARVAKIVQEREEADRQERAQAAAAALAATETKINEQTQGEQISAEFKAQAQEQRLEQPSGTRNKAVYLIDNPADMLRVGKIIGAIVAHAIPNMTPEAKFKSVIAHDKDGKAKFDKDGDPVYTDGVAFWLDLAAEISSKSGYDLKIEGLRKKVKVSTVAKAK